MKLPSKNFFRTLSVASLGLALTHSCLSYAAESSTPALHAAARDSSTPEASTEQLIDELIARYNLRERIPVVRAILEDAQVRMQAEIRRSERRLDKMLKAQAVDDGEGSVTAEDKKNLEKMHRYLEKLENHSIALAIFVGDLKHMMTNQGAFAAYEAEAHNKIAETLSAEEIQELHRLYNDEVAAHEREMRMLALKLRGEYRFIMRKPLKEKDTAHEYVWDSATSEGSVSSDDLGIDSDDETASGPVLAHLETVLDNDHGRQAYAQVEKAIEPYVGMLLKSATDWEHIYDQVMPMRKAARRVAKEWCSGLIFVHSSAEKMQQVAQADAKGNLTKLRRAMEQFTL